MSSAAPRAWVRAAARIDGTVQGVGFRPFVYRLASELELTGWVRNDERGVEIEVEGPRATIELFLVRLPAEAPPLARVEHVRAEPCPAQGQQSFFIAPSKRTGAPASRSAPDAATCPDCLAELYDPRDRRFHYPFINCTNCGPRFTIVRGAPYDRPLTTMASFEMCEECIAEYEEPGSRRFHAQANACPACGPQVQLLSSGAEVPDAVTAAARLLAQGAVVAVKGLGGYHLACRADDEAAVGTLRARKQREDRPFAVMVADLAAACELAVVEDEEATLLRGPARPIVLVPRRADTSVASGVAPGAHELGLMLPYTPLHHLLLTDLGASGLVMTSGNTSNEPIAFEDHEALAGLASIADAFLVHDRQIHVRTDDSVVRVVRVGANRRTLPLRRSRGYVPEKLDLPVAAPRPLLACGAELKSTFCIARGEEAWVSHHIGDLGNWETLRSFQEGIIHFEQMFSVTPEVLVHDLHPDYLSTSYAIARPDVELHGVQHHHAHLAAVLAEHGECGPAVGAIYDGAGYGTDGTVWGGEILVGSLAAFERVGHLRPVRLPGGDRAARQPWRMACSWLAQATGDPRPSLPPMLVGRVDPDSWAAVARIASTGVAAPITSSVGRLCDAIAALCGLCTEVTYEGQAAIELEAAADPAEPGAYAIPYVNGQLDARRAIAAVVGDLARGVSPATISARFHNGLSDATVLACVEVADAFDLSLVVLAGGVFQNRILLEGVAAGVEGAGLRVLTPERLPPNDGAISYGQAAIVAARMAL